VKPSIAILTTTLILVACGESEAPSPASTVAPPQAAAAEPQEPTARPAAAAEVTTTVTATGERQFSDGTHFVELDAQQPTSTDDGRIEVTEIFMYGCPHCFAFEPYFEGWEQRKADYVNVVRIPASWGAAAEMHARAFYTAEVLGKQAEVHTPFYREIHINGNFLETEEKLAVFFGQFGVDEETFISTFNSFAVHTRLQRSKDLVIRYTAPETPSVVVNGKYLTRGSLAESYDNWFDIIDELAAVERAAE